MYFVCIISIFIVKCNFKNNDCRIEIFIECSRNYILKLMQVNSMSVQSFVGGLVHNIFQKPFFSSFKRTMFVLILRVELLV